MGELHRLRFKYTWVHVRVHRSELARRGVLKHEPRCTWVETVQGALCRHVLQTQACEAEENFSAKCTECSFNPIDNKEVAKYLNVELARRRVLGLPPSWHWDESVKVFPLFWSTLYEYTYIGCDGKSTTEKKYQVPKEKVPCWYFFLLVLFPRNNSKKYHIVL